MAGADIVFHLAANADVRFGTEHPRKDLEQNTIATFNVLEAMRATGVRRIAFSSTGSVYGEATVFPTPEDAPFPVQTSLYGASKLAGEGLIQAYCEGFGFRATSSASCRFSASATRTAMCSISTEACARIRRDSACSATAQQRKSYLYVQDCIDAMLLAMERAAEQGEHLQPRAPTSIARSTIRSAGSPGISGSRRTLEYTGGERGWIGDNPFIFLDCTPHSRARLAADADDSRRGHPHARIPADQSAGLLEARA